MAHPPLPRAVLVAVLGLLAAPLAAGAPALAPLALPPLSCDVRCPDLTVDGPGMGPFLTTINYPATDCVVQEGMAPPGLHKVVRFRTSLPNVGQTDLVLGNPAEQPGRFVWSDCHRHYHVIEYAAYRVWEPQDYEAYKFLRTLYPFAPADDVLSQLPPDQQPVRGTKHARCVIDLVVFDPQRAGAPHFRSCSYQGITVGWADLYNPTVTGQWVVIDDLVPARYLMEIEVNAGRRYAETNYWNNSVTAEFAVT